jgi:hypothetical protein
MDLLTVGKLIQLLCQFHSFLEIWCGVIDDICGNDELLVKWLFGYGNEDPDELTIFPGNCGIGIKAELTFPQ